MSPVQGKSAADKSLVVGCPAAGGGRAGTSGHAAHFSAAIHDVPVLPGSLSERAGGGGDLRPFFLQQTGPSGSCVPARPPPSPLGPACFFSYFYDVQSVRGTARGQGGGHAGTSAGTLPPPFIKKWREDLQAPVRTNDAPGMAFINNSQLLFYWLLITNSNYKNINNTKYHPPLHYSNSEGEYHGTAQQSAAGTTAIRQPVFPALSCRPLTHHPCIAPGSHCGEPAGIRRRMHLPLLSPHPHRARPIPFGRRGG